MGDIPHQIKIICPGCSTQFRLKPKKGRLPEGAIPCPKCGDEIPIIEANIRSAVSSADATAEALPIEKPVRAPSAHVFGKGAGIKAAADSGDAPAGRTGKPRRDTATGAPRLSHRLMPPEEDDEFDHIDIARGLGTSNPKSTFLGMGATLAAIEGPGKKDAPDQSDQTAVVDGAVLDQIRQKFSAPEGGAAAQDDTEHGEPDAPESNRHLKETSEHKAISREDLIPPEYAEAPADEDAGDTATSEPVAADSTATSEIPNQMVLGRIKLKRQLKRSLRKTEPAIDTTDLPEYSSASDDSDGDDQEVDQKSDTKPSNIKPSLAALLKKARERKVDLPSPKGRADESAGTPSVPKPQLSDAEAAAARKKSAEALDRALSALADETARALDEKSDSKVIGRMTTAPLSALSAGNDSKKNARQPLPYDTGDSSMIELLRRRVAENQQPGAAGERRGSGYIRLPTAEIQDVLGQGSYRLRVEDIIYEPIDKSGLTELVKRGVLLGAAEIAESDGDWMPIGEHPVLAELRQKMAVEAHDLLAKYSKSPGAKMPEKGAPWPLRAEAGLGGLSDALTDDFSDLKDSAEIASIPALEASRAKTDYEDEDFHTVNSGLFAGVDGHSRGSDTAEPSEPAAQDAASTASAPQAQEPRTPEAAKQTEAPSPALDAPADPAPDPLAEDSSIELDYDALGVEESDVEFTDPEPPDDTPTGPVRVKSRSVWKPVLFVVVLLGGLVALALSPVGRPHVDEFLSQRGLSLDELLTQQGLGKFATNNDGSSADKSHTPPVKQADSPGDLGASALAARGEAIGAASTQLQRAAAVDPSDAELQAKVAARLADKGDHQAAAKILGVLWPQHKNDADFTAQYTAQLIKANQFGRAVNMAVHGIELSRSGKTGAKKHDFSRLYEEAIDKNPELGAYHTVDIKPGEHADAAASALRGKKSERVILQLSLKGTPTFVFKPSQRDWERDWRASIAAWRLCEIMVCNFSIPRTRPARIDRAAFDKLIATDAADSSRFAGLNWVTENGTQYLHGALVDATDAPARFPIESTSLWRGWLSTDGPGELDQPAATALSSLESLQHDFHGPLLQASDSMTFGELASQLSSVLTFDYLTNNWDRFRPAPEDWGAHLGLAHGRLVSTVNVTTFQPRPSTRVKGRFEWAGRFSRATITSLRLMTPETVTPLLFPKASAAEKASIQVFWNQREQVLKRVDKLVQTRGEKKVLAFD